MAAGDVASISGLGSALRSDCDDILRRKVSSRTESRMGPAESGADRFVELQLYSAVN